MPNSQLDPAWRGVAEQLLELLQQQLRASPWLTTQQAADYLGVELRTMETLRRRGEAPRCSKYSNRLTRWHVDDLDAWLRKHMEQADG